MVRRDLADGQHRPPGDEPGWFTTAYLHHPQELTQEAERAGLQLAGLFAIEGVAWLLADLEDWLDEPTHRGHLLWTIRQCEQEPSVLGATSHLLAVTHRPKR